jgi:hypothetical protein
MMKGNNIATLKDLKGINDIEVEVNKNDKQQNFVEIRMKDRDGDWIRSSIQIKDLFGLVFMIVGEKEQEELMPVRKTEVRVYERQHRIKLNKDMKKGEIVVANCRVDIPLMVEEGLSKLIEKKASRTKSGIIVPNFKK